jgi:TolA-binding protein
MARKSDPPAADEQVYDAGGFEAELFWEKNRLAILFSGAIILAIAVAVAIWIITRQSARHAAETLFAGARDPAAWREVVARYPRSAPAASAYLLLAEALRSEGKLEESSSFYQKFLSVFPSQPLTGGAKLGLAENLAAAGKTDEALAALRELQTRDSGSFAAPFAALLEGRALIRLGKMEEARKVLGNVVSTYPQSPAGNAAGTQLDAIVPFLPPGSPAAIQ